ncbi:MAG: c-type cytochrome [Steroidobacteraceae bacterium]
MCRRTHAIGTALARRLTLAVAVLALALIAPAAAAQTERAIDLIGRALAAKPNELHGEELYRELCGSCHGRQAQGVAAPVTPALAGQLTVYLIKQLVDFAEGDRNEPEMHRVIARKELGRPQALRDLTTYLSGLPPNAEAEQGEGNDLTTGKRLYDGLCAFCHGQQGEGNVEHATPALRGQHYSYLLMQSRRLAVGHRYSVPVEIIQVLEKLPFDSLTAISDYASRLAQTPARPAETTHQEQPAALIQTSPRQWIGDDR